MILSSCLLNLYMGHVNPWWLQVNTIQSAGLREIQHVHDRGMNAEKELLKLAIFRKWGFTKIWNLHSKPSLQNELLALNWPNNFRDQDEAIVRFERWIGQHPIIDQLPTQAKCLILAKQTQHVPGLLNVWRNLPYLLEDHLHGKTRIARTCVLLGSIQGSSIQNKASCWLSR